MSKVDIISGFLGAGKTTLIKKLLKDSSLKDEQVVLIENEFGEIGIDGGFMRDAGIQVNELSQGCICCSLVGDFEKALKQVLDTYHPDRIIIEPSGVGKLSDIIAAVEAVHSDDLELDAFYTVVDAKKCKMYHKNFGEFFNNQIANASVVVLSRTQDVDEDKLATDLDIIQELNDHAAVVTTPWDEISGDAILKAAENKESLEKALMQATEEHEVESHHHHHHHHDHDHEHEHHHDHDHEHEEEHEHHHHHHHDHDHDHSGAALEDEGSKAYFDEEDLHDADEVFNSIGIETAHAFTKEELESKLQT
ncbi:MAG TPA: cobalamin biosynthesis protein CobW, partial [Erysipelotrichaceae bacterium]|nr:cobalamin biosynthesis protein CobW [Erysipelotrichaceae bacterium]